MRPDIRFRIDEYTMSPFNMRLNSCNELPHPLPVIRYRYSTKFRQKLSYDRSSKIHLRSDKTGRTDDPWHHQRRYLQHFRIWFFLNSDEVTDRIVNALLKYDDKFFLLLDNGGDLQFMKKLQESAKDFVYRLLGNTDDLDIPKDYIAAYSTSSFSGILSHWYETGVKEDLHKIVATRQKLIMYGLSGLWRVLLIKTLYSKKRDFVQKPRFFYRVNLLFAL